MSNATDHLAKAKDYIAKGDEYYAKAGVEMKALRDLGWAWTAIGREVDRSDDWVRRVVAAASTSSRARIDWESGSNKRDDVAAKVLANPEQRRQVIASLPADVREAVIEESHEAAIADVRAKQAEHDMTPKAPTAGDLMGGDRFDPSESWADTHIIRVQSKAHALARQVAKWGLVLGSLSEEEAFQMLQEAESNIAEVRVALQERISDRSRTEV